MNTGTHQIREASVADVDLLVALDQKLEGPAKRDWWERILSAYGEGESGVALVAADGEGALVGYLFGEVRAWEFGSERCGWIFAVAVDPELAREGLATTLCELAIARFKDMGVAMVRTMVRRDAVPVLAFFRSMGFAGGPFSELERSVEMNDE